MLSMPIVARLLGGNGRSREAQETFRQEVQSAAFHIDPAMRYYIVSDFHLEPEGPEHQGLTRFLGRLLSEGGIGGVFLMGDLAARPGIRYEQLAAAHPQLFDTLYRLAVATPVYLIQGECDLELEPPEFLRVVERFEDERWILVHGWQYDPAVEVTRDEEDPDFLHVLRGEPNAEATLAALRELRQRSGKQVVFGHLHRAAYVQPGLICVGHWTGRAADYGIIRDGQLYLLQGRATP
jgi:predicted phosphodiesterase